MREHNEDTTMLRRRTKIVCTVGPASNDWDTMRAMQEAGMDAVRINMSHATQEDAARTVEIVNKLNHELQYPVPIMLDTNGPEIRTGVRSDPLRLRQGERVIVSGSNNPEGLENLPVIQVGYPRFEETVRKGDKIRFDNGLINLKVKKKTVHGLLCHVLDGGKLGSRKHVNLPGVYVELPSISAKDEEDVMFAKEHDISFIAQSFVRTPSDIQTMRNLLGESHQWVKVIAKIENQEGVREVETIAAAADGLMVARGDLGIETDLAALPRLQRKLVQTTLKLGRRCLLATHLLESMIENPIPTRAETIDVANAVYEGVDAVILSAETSVGQRPAVAVQQLRRIIEESEQTPGLNFSQALVTNDVKQNVAWSAVELAERIDASGIMVVTRSGYMADLITNCAPLHVPILAFSNSVNTRTRLMVNRGVYTHSIPFDMDPEKTIQTALQVLSERERVQSGERFVLVSDVLSHAGVESIQIRQL